MLFSFLLLICLAYLSATNAYTINTKSSFATTKSSHTVLQVTILETGKDLEIENEDGVNLCYDAIKVDQPSGAPVLYLPGKKITKERTEGRKEYHVLGSISVDIKCKYMTCNHVIYACM